MINSQHPARVRTIYDVDAYMKEAESRPVRNREKRDTERERDRERERKIDSITENKIASLKIEAKAVSQVRIGIVLTIRGLFSSEYW